MSPLGGSGTLKVRHFIASPLLVAVSYLGVSYCSLSCVIFCTGADLIMFHSSQLPVPLTLFCGSVGLTKHG